MIFQGRTLDSRSADSGVTVVLTPRAAAQIDSIAAKADSTKVEQFACVERFTIDTARNGHRLITIVRLGASPIRWASDSANIWAPENISHLCYRGDPGVHTHSSGVDWPSETDFHTAWEGYPTPFSVLITFMHWGDGTVVWKATLYAVKP